MLKRISRAVVCAFVKNVILTFVFKNWILYILTEKELTLYLDKK